jgi:hypothetical protein
MGDWFLQTLRVLSNTAPLISNTPVHSLRASWSDMTRRMRQQGHVLTCAPPADRNIVQRQRLYSAVHRPEQKVQAHMNLPVHLHTAIATPRSSHTLLRSNSYRHCSQAHVRGRALARQGRNLAGHQSAAVATAVGAENAAGHKGFRQRETLSIEVLVDGRRCPPALCNRPDHQRLPLSAITRRKDAL